jgi:hypothetical protein
LITVLYSRVVSTLIDRRPVDYVKAPRLGHGGLGFE